MADISNMVDHFLHQSSLEYPGERVVLWKMDLKGAYTLLSFCAEDVPLMGSELTDGLIMFFLCGIFGWTGTPACFQVVTRAIAHELITRLRGKVKVYVDDIFGVTRQCDLDYDLGITTTVCETMLGPDAVEVTKTEVGPRLGVIGYEIDLELRLVAVAHKNVLKALHGFLSTNVDAPTTVKALQRLASWASRYGEICRYMRPYVGALYAAYTGRKTMGTFPIPAAARISILLFRVLLSLTSVLERQFTRALGSFQPTSPQWIVEFDASLLWCWNPVVPTRTRGL
mmetsp:Transcript_3656/g.5177  ORF Transcript_3656/g.5177 Transcript_3656/m.5177 type:complete len:284 (-) Transcript_3656:387-1238(-)